MDGSVDSLSNLNQGSVPVQKRRARGLSLRSQLFNKNLYLQSSPQKELDIELGNYHESQNNQSSPVSNSETTDNSHNDLPNLSKISINSSRNSTFIRPESKSSQLGLQSISWLRKLKNKLLGIEILPPSKNGRNIPISMNHKSFERFGDYITCETATGWLIDERREAPFLSNVITSSRYNVYSFLPKQLYAQFSKVANCYFMIIAIMQMIPSWSTTGTYTTIIPLLIFMSISMAREGYDDWRRHVFDKDENSKLITVLKDIEINSLESIQLVLNDIEDDKSISESDTGESSSESILDSFLTAKELKRMNIKQIPIEWKDLKVGNIIRIYEDEEIPADILLLASSNDSSEAFIETMALDGETNLKSRSPHEEISKTCSTAQGLKDFSEMITIEDPNTDLYNFEGQLEINEERFPLGPENVLYRGSVLRNTLSVIGVVIFTGEETKIRMNNVKNPRTKAPKLQKSINNIVSFMVIIVILLSVFSLMAERIYYKRYREKNWYLFDQDIGVAATLMGFVIMYNTLIPLSLYVTMEAIKVMQLLYLQYDIDMFHAESDTPAVAKTATILEELGQVSYIFSDKTGTLTDNMMIFRKFSICGVSWLHDLDLISKKDSGPSIILKQKKSSNFELDPPPRKSLGSIARYSNDLRSISTNNGWVADAYPSKPQVMKNSLQLIKFIQTHPNTLFSKKAKFFFLSIALCNACLPKKNPIDSHANQSILHESDIEDGNENEDDRIEYQAASPDELALVQAARDLGYVVFDRQNNKLFLKTYPHGFKMAYEIEEYQILDVIKFSSARKRMSVVVKFPDNRISLICKGADNIILEKLKNSEMAIRKAKQISQSSTDRKTSEAELVLQQARISLNLQPPKVSIGDSIRNSFSSSKGYERMNSIDNYINKGVNEDDLQRIVSNSKKSLHLQQSLKYSIDQQSIHSHVDEHLISNKDESFDSFIPSDVLLVNDEYLVEKTLEHIEEFSTEGLRTLLYSFRWLDSTEYEKWAAEYSNAKSSLIDRNKQIEKVGEDIEINLQLIGATAIEDKLQEGVSDAIEKLRRAGIKMWMLTGDKRETAINIGYSCRLIKDYSSIIILKHDEGQELLVQQIGAAYSEILTGGVAHSVVVVDGATLAEIESDTSMFSSFIELCVKSDSVICCRASPAQKASMVSAVRELKGDEVTLAIGDGANDIAMIQSADIGIGITGKEGLQAARASDYSIAQFRFLLKLLLVHGRYNYVRTSKFVLCTFYKEFMFYLTQAIYQRQTLFTGSSLYESWSLSMFNTLFTSLPVLCIGMFDKDLKPSTLLAVPELYSKGRLYTQFNMKLFLSWMILGTVQSLIVSFSSWEIWGFTSLRDNTVFPMGDMTFAALVILISVKCQFIEMQNKTWLPFASVIISIGGYGLWNVLIMLLYREKESPIYFVAYGLTETFGVDPSWWASLLLVSTMPILLDLIIQVFKFIISPSDEDIFRVFEKNFDMRRYFEENAVKELFQGWTWPREDSIFTKKWNSLKKNLGMYIEEDLHDSEQSIVVGRKRAGTNPTQYELPPSADGFATYVSNSPDDVDVLPSGKVRKRETEKTSSISMFAKKFKKETDADIDDIIVKRMESLERENEV